jgi:signal transduction histidine kinase
MLLCDIRWHGNHYNLEERDGIVATLQDSHKLLDEVSEELRKSIRAQNTYVIGKSHDLRSPLNVIIGFTELLLDQVPGKINEEQRQALNDILASSRHLQNVIDDILGRLEKDRGVSDKSAP